MKTSLVLLLLFVSHFSYSQSAPTHHHNQSKSAYFVDSVRVSSITMDYINPDDIQDVFISKDFNDKANNYYGAIYITTKNPKAYHFIDLEEIKKVKGISVTGTTIYMVDNQFIKDTQYFKLPSSVIHSFILTKGNEFDSLKSDLPNLSIVKIITNKNAPKSTGLMIRGIAEK